MLGTTELAPRVPHGDKPFWCQCPEAVSKEAGPAQESENDFDAEMQSLSDFFIELDEGGFLTTEQVSRANEHWHRLKKVRSLESPRAQSVSDEVKFLKQTLKDLRQAIGASNSWEDFMSGVEDVCEEIEARLESAQSRNPTPQPVGEMTQRNKEDIAFAESVMLDWDYASMDDGKMYERASQLYKALRHMIAGLKYPSDAKCLKLTADLESGKK
jgi:hypothetical protein